MSTDADRGDDGPFRVVDTRRRAMAATVYLVMAAVAGSIVLVSGIPAMWLTGVAPLLLLACYQLLGSWRIAVSDHRAIEIAGSVTSFAVGHGSATLGYRGILAKPVWQVLVFADTPSPDHQALVTVDAMTGDVTGRYEEAVDVP